MELQEIQKLVAAGYTKEEIDALDKEQKKQQDETFWQDMSSKQPQEGSEDYQVRDYLWKQKNLELAEKYSKRTYIWALLGIWPATFFGSIVALIYSSKAKKVGGEDNSKRKLGHKIAVIELILIPVVVCLGPAFLFVYFLYYLF